MRLSSLYTALQETRQLARRLSKLSDKEFQDSDADKLFDLIDSVRANANMVAIAYSPGVFTSLYSRVADFVVWMSDGGDPPAGKTGLEQIEHMASELAGAVFELSTELNSVRKN